MDQLRYYTKDISSLIGCLHVISTSKLGKITCPCYMLDYWLLNDVQWWLSMFSKDASANFGTLGASVVPIISTPESVPFISRTSLMFFGRARFELRMILRKRIHAYKPMITNLLTVITGAQTYIKIEPLSIKLNWFSRRKVKFSCSNAEHNEPENWLVPWCCYRIYRYYD